LRLLGHAEEGFALSWNPLKSGTIASGANDGKICVWDITGSISLEKGNRMDPHITIETPHLGLAVEDICWSHFDENLMLSVGDDKSLTLWDSRDTRSPSS